MVVINGLIGFGLQEPEARQRAERSADMTARSACVRSAITGARAASSTTSTRSPNAPDVPDAACASVPSRVRYSALALRIDSLRLQLHIADIQCAALRLSQLRRLERFIVARDEIAERLPRAPCGVRRIAAGRGAPGDHHLHLFIIRFKARAGAAGCTTHCTPRYRAHSLHPCPVSTLHGCGCDIAGLRGLRPAWNSAVATNLADDEAERRGPGRGCPCARRWARVALASTARQVPARSVPRADVAADALGQELVEVPQRQAVAGAIAQVVRRGLVSAPEIQVMYGSSNSRLGRWSVNAPCADLADRLQARSLLRAVARLIGSSERIINATSGAVERHVLLDQRLARGPRRRAAPMPSV